MARSRFATLLRILVFKSRFGYSGAFRLCPRILRKWVQNTRETGFKKTQGPIFGARSIQKAPRNHDKSSRLCPTLVWYTGCLRLMRAPTGANGCELEFGHILKFRAPTMGIREGVLP